MLYALFALLLPAAAVAVVYLCYRMAFYVPDRKPGGSDEIQLPEGEIYKPFWEKMEHWARETRKLPREDLSITSFDGLQLWGSYYEYAPGAPIELMFHGYRGNAERDLAGGVQRCFKLGHSCLVVDQRSSSRSGGNTITFGVYEHKDCLAWVDFMCRHFGEDVQIILTGISMGASTVLMAAGNPLPNNVVGVLADCGFSSAREIIQVVIRNMGLPPKISYPFVKLAAKWFGRFDLEGDSAIRAVQRATVPILFFHGESDDFVPCQMSRELYAACKSKKMLVTVPGAGHGLSYPVQPTEYLDAMRAFFDPLMRC